MLKYPMFTINSTLLPFLFSFFIYAEYFHISFVAMNTMFALLGYFLLLQLNKKELFTAGFFTSILWFWWVGYSFVHYELSYLIPFVLLAIGFLYGFLFYILGFMKNIYLKVVYIFAISFINPFEFNWFKIELPLINSYLGTSKIEFLIILLITALFIQYKQRYKKESISLYIIGVVCLIIFNISSLQKIAAPNIKIYSYNTSIPQEKRWDQHYTQEIIDNNFQAIDEAIAKKYDLIILPETSFPLILNKQDTLMQHLLEKSKKISILLGSLYQDQDQLHNSTFLFQNNKLQVAHKVVLVPFGEAVPLPEKIRDWINDMFYNGASDYITAKKPTTFSIKGVKFRNAICYEATSNKIFQNIDTNYMIAISNNAWFTPSIQPTLQKLLMRYYSHRYNVSIFSVSNQ